VHRKKNTSRDQQQQDPLDRSDQVAASASPQGDGIPTADMGTAEAADPAATAADSYMSTDGAAAESSGATIGTRSELAEEAQRALADQRDKFLRLAAEYDNYRKRTTRERQEAGARAQGELVKQLLDALDDLGRFAHVDPATVDAATVVHGVELVERKLLKALGAAGMEVVNPLDEPFNPERHEAVATEPTPSREDDHIVSRVYQHGYLFNGQLLRPARVVVKQWNG
jgi:molecular chaperone GrpE